MVMIMMMNMIIIMIIIIVITVIIVIMNMALIGFQRVLKGLRRELINARLCGCKAAYRVVCAGLVEVLYHFSVCSKGF